MNVCGKNCKSKPTHDWIALRLTALINIPLTIWVAYVVSGLKHAGYDIFILWLSVPYNAALMILFIVSVYFHAALGMHEIIEDYVSDEKTKHTMLLVKKLVFFALGAISVLAVLKVALA